MDRQQNTEQEHEEISHCNWHPDVETGLSCGRCEKSMCTRCMVQASVGIRCRDCGKAVPLPTYDVQTGYYARAVAVGVFIAIFGGLLWAACTAVLSEIPFTSALTAFGISYATGYIISISVHRKRGVGLAWISGASVVGAFLVSWLVVPFSFGIFGLLIIGFGIYTAVQQVR